jgi:hypothetical protein
VIALLFKGMISEELEQIMRHAEDPAIRAFNKQTGLKLHGYTPSVMKNPHQRVGKSTEGVQIVPQCNVHLVKVLSEDTSAFVGGLA